MADNARAMPSATAPAGHERSRSVSALRVTIGIATAALWTFNIATWWIV